MYNDTLGFHNAFILRRILNEKQVSVINIAVFYFRRKMNIEC